MPQYKRLKEAKKADICLMLSKNTHIRYNLFIKETSLAVLNLFLLYYWISLLQSPTVYHHVRLDVTGNVSPDTQTTLYALHLKDINIAKQAIYGNSCN